MPRYRTIKPEFWDDPLVANLPPLARLLFIGTWNFADDYGVILGDPVWLRSKIFPFDDSLRGKEFMDLISALGEARMLIPLTWSGTSYYKIRTFQEHQRVDKPGERSIPEDVETELLARAGYRLSGKSLENIREPFLEHSENIPRTFVEDSANDPGTFDERSSLERKREEKKGKERRVVEEEEAHLLPELPPLPPDEPTAIDGTVDQNALAVALGGCGFQVGQVEVIIWQSLQSHGCSLDDLKSAKENLLNRKKPISITSLRNQLLQKRIIEEKDLRLAQEKKSRDKPFDAMEFLKTRRAKRDGQPEHN
jgi:hypothetical protein